MKKSKLDAHQALNTSNAERPLKLKIQEIVDADTARLEAQPDRMHLLACKEHLGLGDWIEITGIGIGGESHYTISEESIRFIGWDDETIRSSQAYQQPNLIRQNEAWCDIVNLNRELDAEGTIIKGKINVKFRLVETLHKRATSLARHLQIHARATRGEARDTARLKPTASVDDPDGLLA